MSESWIIDDFAAALDQFEAAMQVVPASDLDQGRLHPVFRVGAVIVFG